MIIVFVIVLDLKRSFCALKGFRCELRHSVVEAKNVSGPQSFDQINIIIEKVKAKKT